MDAIGWFGALVVAAAAQWANSYKFVPAPLVKGALALIGLCFYSLGHGGPAAWLGEPLAAWLNPGLLWALALPGAASLMGTIPGMESNSKS